MAQSSEIKRLLTTAEQYDICDFLTVAADGEWETVMATLEETRRELFLQMKDITLYPSQIPKFKASISKAYWASQIDPGSAVGADASLAIGEPTTQMSVRGDTQIMVDVDGRITSTTMGKFIDAHMNNPLNNVRSHNRTSQVLSCRANNLVAKIASVSVNERVTWNVITELSRHPTHGNLVCVTTASGRSVTCTLSHSFLARSARGIVPIRGSDLRVGHYIPVVASLPSLDRTMSVNGWRGDITLDESFGEWIGSYIACGNITSANTLCLRSKSEHYVKNFYSSEYNMDDVGLSASRWVVREIGSVNKRIPDFAFSSGLPLITGLLRGLFDNGGAFYQRPDSISYLSRDHNLINQIATLLSHHNIHSSVIESDIGYTLYIVDHLYLKYYTRDINSNCKHIVNVLETFIGAPDDVVTIPNARDLIFDIADQLCINLSHHAIKLDSSHNHVDRAAALQCLQLFDRLNKMPSLSSDIAILRSAVHSHVVWDMIIGIEIIVPRDDERVYDFSVAVDETFSLSSGILVHNTLNTFHLAGVSAANVTLGVPRFNEILNASKKQKTNVLSIRLYSDTGDLQTTRDKCRSIFEERYIDQCITSHTVVKRQYECLSKQDLSWYSIFDLLYNKHYRECDWSIRLVLNRSVMYDYRLTTQIVSLKIESEYRDCRCVWSPDHIGIVDVYVDTRNVDSPSVIMAQKKKTGKKTRSNIVDRLLDSAPPLINDSNKDYYFVARVAVDYILDIKINGIEGISKIYYSLDNKTKQWNIEASGTNMREAMNHPDVDFRHVVSNNMWEIFAILGIEAARRFLVSEITTTVSFGGTFIDPVHPTLLADSMTSTGIITSVNRYGISKSVVGVLTPASFEQSHQNMLDAPAKGVTDDLSTVSAGIIVGKHIRIGTGYFGLVTDTGKLQSQSLNSSKSSGTLQPINEDVDSVPNDPRFPTSNAVFRKYGTGVVVERSSNTTTHTLAVDNTEYIDF